MCFIYRARTNGRAFTDDSHGLSVHQKDLDDHRKRRVDPDVDHTLRFGLQSHCTVLLNPCSGLRIFLAGLEGKRPQRQMQAAKECIFCDEEM